MHGAPPPGEPQGFSGVQALQPHGGAVEQQQQQHHHQPYARPRLHPPEGRVPNSHRARIRIQEGGCQLAAPQCVLLGGPGGGLLRSHPCCQGFVTLSATRQQADACQALRDKARLVATCPALLHLGYLHLRAEPLLLRHLAGAPHRHLCRFRTPREGQSGRSRGTEAGARQQRVLVSSGGPPDDVAVQHVHHGATVALVLHQSLAWLAGARVARLAREVEEAPGGSRPFDSSASSRFGRGAAGTYLSIHRVTGGQPYSSLAKRCKETAAPGGNAAQDWREGKLTGRTAGTAQGGHGRPSSEASSSGRRAPRFGFLRCRSVYSGFGGGLGPGRGTKDRGQRTGGRRQETALGTGERGPEKVQVSRRGCSLLL
eukprot:jgi/Mesen1/8511/ME000480S07869